MNDVLASKFALLRVRIESDIKLGSVIMVTSARPGDGKSLCAHGLAEGLTKVGHRAVFVDAAGERAAQPARGDFSTVALSAEALGVTTSREAVFAFVAQMRTKNDYTIIDAGPLMSNSVAMFLAAAVDAVLLAVRHGRAPGEDDDVMVQTLRHLKAKVFGVIASSADTIVAFENRRAAHYADEPRSNVVEPRIPDAPASALVA